jgi:hypothetical protein
MSSLALPPNLKVLVGNIPPALLVALALAVPVTLAAVKWLRGWAARRQQQRPLAPVAPRAGGASTPRPDRLQRVWKQFLRRLPALLRRSVFQFQPFLVLGEAGSGKSRLIDTCTDWKQQERRLLGGSLDDPELRICLGSRVLLLELAPQVVWDGSAAGREALWRLWKPLFRRRSPVVVVTLNVATLASTPVDVARGLADTLRGKLNLLTRLHGKPPEVRVVLTHLDEVKGYEAFAALLAKQHVRATLALNPKDWESASHLERALHRRLKSFERLLPLALTTSPSADYLRLVAFLEKAPPYLTPVAHFLATLGAPNTHLPAPRMERVYLAALHDQGEGANPFHAEDDARTPRVGSPLWPHRLAALACATLGALYLLPGYLYERALWLPARQAVLEYQEAFKAEGPAGKAPDKTQTNDGERMRRQAIARFLHRREDMPMRYLPGFFSSQDELLEQRLSDGLRERYILPALHATPGLDEPHRRGLYLLAVLYASNSNLLGGYVLANLPHWVEATGLDQEIIEAYVHNTARPYEKAPPLPVLPPPGGSDASNDAQRWLAFLRQLDKALHQDVPLSSRELAALRQEARDLREGLRVIERFGRTQFLLTELTHATGTDLSRYFAPALDSVNAPGLFGETRALVEPVLKRVTGETVEGVRSEPLLLSELNDRLQGLEGAPRESGDKVLTLEMPAQGFTLSFQPQRWESLIRDSAAHELVQGFLAPTRPRPSIFFSSPEGEARTGPKGKAVEPDDYLFTSPPPLQDPYTLEAYEKSVYAVLARYTPLAERLSARDRSQLEGLITGEMVRYSRNYLRRMESYYQSFGVHADSNEALKLLLGQMLEPASPFNDFLNTVARNTAPRLDDTQVPLVAPMKVVRERFAPLHELLAEQKPGVSGLEPYRALLEQMRQELAPEVALEAKSDTATEEDPDAETDAGVGAPTARAAPVIHGLQEQLSPVGRMSLAMLRHDKGAYDELVWSWIKKRKLDGGLEGPFSAPLGPLREVGKAELESAVKSIWRDQLQASLSDVQGAFPFKRDSQRDVSPQELEALFHPRKGRFHLLFRQYLEPISVHQPSGWRALPGLVARVPPYLYSTLNNVERLTNALWDAEGNPQPLRFTITSVPFKSGVRHGAVLTLVYLHSGSDSVLNFNQQPTPRTLSVDWTRPRQARLSIETIDPATGSKTYPSALLSDISPWSMLHLLRRASEQEDNTWSWSLALASNASNREEPKVSVKFRIRDDPWSPFTLQPQAVAPEATAIASPP